MFEYIYMCIFIAHMSKQISTGHRNTYLCKTRKTYPMPLAWWFFDPIYLYQLGLLHCRRGNCLKAVNYCWLKKQELKKALSACTYYGMCRVPLRIRMKLFDGHLMNSVAWFMGRMYSNERRLMYSTVFECFLRYVPLYSVVNMLTVLLPHVRIHFYIISLH